MTAFRIPRPARLSTVLTALAGGALTAFVGTWAGVLVEGFRSRHRWQRPDAHEAPPIEVLLVFGAKTRHGRPLPQLQARLERAAEIHSQTGATILVTGGATADAPRDRAQTEAAIMADALQQRGIDRGHIWLEPRARSTAENIEYSLPMLSGIRPDRIAVVTSDYHCFRVRLLCRGRQLPWRVIGAPTTLGFRWKGAAREVAALLTLAVSARCARFHLPAFPPPHVPSRLGDAHHGDVHHGNAHHVHTHHGDTP